MGNNWRRYYIIRNEIRNINWRNELLGWWFCLFIRIIRSGNSNGIIVRRKNELLGIFEWICGLRDGGNKMEEVYLVLGKKILEEGYFKEDCIGIGMYSLFGY